MKRLRRERPRERRSPIDRGHTRVSWAASESTPIEDVHRAIDLLSRPAHQPSTLFVPQHLYDRLQAHYEHKEWRRVQRICRKMRRARRRRRGW